MSITQLFAYLENTIWVLNNLDPDQLSAHDISR